MKRRNFFYNLFAFIPLTLGFLGISKMGLDFLTTRRKSKYRRIFALALSSLAINESKEMTDLKGRKFTLVRTADREVKALSTVCTHLGCSVHWESDKNRFFCPCHAGVFDPDGNVVSGPPPKKLDSYQTEIDGDNIYIYLMENEA